MSFIYIKYIYLKPCKWRSSTSSDQRCKVLFLIVQEPNDCCVYCFFIKKGLKIPQGQSESVYQRRTDNTMAKRKKYKRTNNDLQNIHIKLKIE